MLIKQAIQIIISEHSLSDRKASKSFTSLFVCLVACTIKLQLHNMWFVFFITKITIKKRQMNRLNWLQFWLKKKPEDSSMRVNKKKRKTSEVLLHVNCIKANELSRGKWPSMRFSLILVRLSLSGLVLMFLTDYRSPLVN